MYWRVDGVALSEAAHGVVARLDVGQVSAAAKHGLGIAFLPRAVFGLLHVLMHLWERVEIVVDKLPGLLVAYVHSLSQSEGRDAIYYAEVGLLGLLALSVAHVLHGLLPYLGSRGAVDVETLTEGLYHVLVAREVSHYSELYL